MKERFDVYRPSGHVRALARKLGREPRMGAPKLRTEKKRLMIDD